MPPRPASAVLPVTFLFLATAAQALGPAAADRTIHLQTFDEAWRLVHEHHFDRTFNGVDWEAVRLELRPRAERAGDVDELRAIVQEMLARLGQSHFALLPGDVAGSGSGGPDRSGDVGLEFRIIGTEAVVTAVDPGGPAALAGIRPGWSIERIADRDVEDLLAGLPPGLPDARRTVEAWRLLLDQLRGSPGSVVEVTFADGGGPRHPIALRRREEPGHPARIGHLPPLSTRLHWERREASDGRSIGIIRFNVWMPPIAPLFDEAVDQLRDARGIVLDLRGNPGGLAGMLMGISGHFVAERVSLGRMVTRDATLQLVANPRLVNPAGKRVEPLEGPLAILIDGLTGSASECFAGGLQAIGRARIFGEPSMGQALPSLFHRLPNGDVLLYAYADFVTPTGVRLEGRGVIPDEAVAPTRADLLAGRDGALLAALHWIREEVDPQRPARSLREE